MAEFVIDINKGQTDDIVRFKAAMPDGSERHFTLRKLTVGPLAAARRAESLYRRANDIDLVTVGEDGEKRPTMIPISELVWYIMGDAGLLRWFVSEVYEGDHEGIDWAAQDGQTVEIMLNLFFTRNFKSESLSSSASKTSSSASATSSKAAARRSPRKASTTGTTKKRQPTSRRPRPNTTG